MKYLDGPDARPARTLYSHPRPGIDRVEYVVSTRAECSLAWKIFSDWKGWHAFSNIYGRMEWRGDPWTPGSRMRIEILKPVETVVDHVITVCSPPRCVAWIDHVMGYTMEQWVLLDPSYTGGARISTWAEFTGGSPNPECEELLQFFRRFIEEWYTRFAAECDRAAQLM